jgi:hypothetical protein
MPVVVTVGTTMAGEPPDLAGELPVRFGLGCSRAGIRPVDRSAGRSAATR